MKYIAGFIGVGNMGGALLESVSAAVGGESVAMFDLSKDKLFEKHERCGANIATLNELVDESKYIFLGVKPNVLPGVLDEIKDRLSSETVLVSMAAGVSVCDIAKHCGNERIIRIMPNTPVSVGQGMILYCVGKDVSADEISMFLSLLSKAGKTDNIDEKSIDAAAALSGCGPAFAYMFIEALCDGAVKCGLSREKAMMYAEQTLLGSAELAMKSGRHPGELKDAVCSPGGTTIEGVLALERGGFRSAVSSAVSAAYEKTAKLKK
jgi:pyrroline-5-carboxylate reductase